MPIKALVFDTFGTVVDWRAGIASEFATWATAQYGRRDWEGFADQWRSRYQPQMERVRSGAIPWTKLDDLHGQVLDEILPQFDLHGVDQAHRHRFNTVWHRLPPWPDLISDEPQLSHVVRHRGWKMCSQPQEVNHDDEPSAVSAGTFDGRVH